MPNKKRYYNLNRHDPIKSFRDIRKWRKEARKKKKDYTYSLSTAMNLDRKYIRTNDSTTTITWVGHATFLIQLDGVNILTDPVWARRMGFKRRLVPPGIKLQELPDIHIVLISHAHYDHLNFHTLRQLKGEPLHLVPVGLKAKFEKKGFSRVREFQWWEDIHIKSLHFTFVPAQHWSRRSLYDTNTSHWGGWIIRKPGQETFYFVGDSAYFEGFKEIGQRFNIDCVMMPIGAYEPEWFMSDHHVTPEEAVQAFLDVKGKIFIPMHYGTFPLADDTPKEALDRLSHEWLKRKLPPSRLKKMSIGESLIR